MDTIGVICEPDHPVFGRVAERLAARGFGVEFLSPRERLDSDRIDDLAAVASAVITRGSFAGLRRADRAGVETWNGFAPASALSCRLVGLHALERLGLLVPAIDRSPADGDGVRKPRFRWDARGTERSGPFEERIRSDPVTYRYYAVDDGVETHVQALTVRSELTDRQSILGDADVDVELATRVRELLDRFDARAVGVDFVDADGEFYAVDVDPAPQFHGAGMERHVADSLASLTTIGA